MQVVGGRAHYLNISLRRRVTEPFGPDRESNDMSSSFDEVFEEEFEQLYGYLRRRVGTAVAEDLTAEAFAVAYRRWGDRDPLRATRPWLYGIANNLLRHHWRKERRMLRAYSRTGPDQAIQDDDAPL